MLAILWCRTVGQVYANQLRRRRPQPGDKWHLDEVFLKINGETHYLWRAVDRHGNVLDILVAAKRDKQAAKRFFRQLLRGCRYVPRVIISDKWRRYGAAKQEIMPTVEHRQHTGLNNRAETSHQPTRQKERQIRRFKSAGHAQRMLSAVEPIRGHFRLRRHKRPAAEYRGQRTQRFELWKCITGIHSAA